jgi:hypothetical protein
LSSSGTGTHAKDSGQVPAEKWALAALEAEIQLSLGEVAGNIGVCAARAALVGLPGGQLFASYGKRLHRGAHTSPLVLKRT